MSQNTHTRPPDTINQFVVVGEHGFLTVDGPFEVLKDGKVWGIVVPNDEIEIRLTRHWLMESTGMAAVLLADCEPVGGGVVEDVVEVEGHDELHIVVDQYAAEDQPAIENE